MNWETLYTAYPVAPKLAELSKEHRPIAFLHRPTLSFGEFVPSDGAYWFLWCTENGPTGSHDVCGNNKPSILPVAWVSIHFFAPRIPWSEAEFMLRETTIFSHWEPSAPWKFNRALFSSDEDYRRRGLGIGQARTV